MGSTRAYGRRYYAKNCDKLLERKRAYEAADPERRRKWRRDYYAANKDKICARKKEKYLVDPEKYRARVRAYYSRNQVSALLTSARSRAKKRGIEFTLKAEHVVIPDRCPVLGIELRKGGRGDPGGSDNSPSLDRVRPELGYVPGNVVVISHRANRIKQNASVEELERVVRWMRLEAGL